MAVHLTLNYVDTLCRRSVGELAGDSYTTDILRATGPGADCCPECLDKLDVPRNIFDVIVESERAYETGYSNGKDKAYFELEIWDPRYHDFKTGCGCRACVAVRTILKKVFGGGGDDGTATR